MSNQDIQDLNISNFDGPLDLLLELVKDKKMDIFDINLTELSNAYINIIEKLKEKKLYIAVEYLVMASKLIYLKTKVILASKEEQKEAEKEKGDLLKQLYEYQQYKKLAAELRAKEIERKNFFIKKPETYSKYEFKVDETILDGKGDSTKLIKSLRLMFERMHAKKLKQATIETFNLSPAERRMEILEIIKEKKDIEFSDIFAVPTMNHFVVTMLTVLDMVRKQELLLEQDEQFGEIKISVGGELNE